MSQSDLVIQNDDGQNFRLDIQAALQAIGSCQEGASNPGTTYKCMLFANSSSLLLKMRNSTDSGWVTIGTLDEAYLGHLTLATAQTITARHTINTIAVGAPFTLGANNQEQKVVHFNADHLDGYDASLTPGDSIIPVGDSNGRIAWGAKPAFRGCLVRITAAKSISDSVWQAVQFSDSGEDYDTDTIHNLNANSGKRLVVPAGVTKVRISGNVSWEANATGVRRIVIYKNGAYGYNGCVYDDRLPISGSLATRMNFCSPVLSVAATNYFELFVYQNSTGALNVLGDSTCFAMEIVE
jgi:hypothetical protein